MGLPRRFWPALLSVALVALGACGGSSDGTPVAVTAREYAYRGFSDSLEAGKFSFSLDNSGEEVHELQLFKLDDDLATVTALLDRPQDESLDKMTSIGVATADPGKKESFDAELTAGRYAAVCFIPVGTKPGGGHSGHDMEEMEDIVFDPNADTHFKRGMYAEFEVVEQPGGATP